MDEFMEFSQFVKNAGIPQFFELQILFHFQQKNNSI